MSIVKTIVLFVIFAVLAVYVYFYEIKGGEERELEEQTAQKVIPFEKDSVKNVEIRSTSDRFYFERMDDTWRIEKPIETGADKTMIDRLLNNIRNMRLVREFTIKAEEQKNYGLADRAYRVTVQFNNGKRDSVRFGDATPVGGDVFAARNDTLVYTVPSYVKTTVSKGLFDWRNKSLTQIQQKDVKEFSLKNSHGVFHFVKEGDSWLIKEPRETRAENAVVDGVLRKFETGKAKSIISEELKSPQKYDLARPAYQIDFYLGDAKAHKNVILSRLKNNISNVKDDSRPQVMTVDSLFIRDIDKTLYQFRYKNISEYDKNSVDSIVVTQGDSILYLTKKGEEDWFLNGKQKVKSWKMNTLLTTVNNLKAKSFLMDNVSAPTKYGLDKPERKIEIFQHGNKIQSVVLGTYKNKKVAFSPGSKMVVEIENNAYKNLEVKPADFVDTSVKKPEDMS